MAATISQNPSLLSVAVGYCSTKRMELAIRGGCAYRKMIKNRRGRMASQNCGRKQVISANGKLLFASLAVARLLATTAVLVEVILTSLAPSLQHHLSGAFRVHVFAQWRQVLLSKDVSVPIEKNRVNPCQEKPREEIVLVLGGMLVGRLYSEWAAVRLQRQ